MAAIHDLLAQIQDEALRERIEKEVNKLSKTKKFGLVFEEHLPECTPLYDMPIKVGCNVMMRNTKEDKSLYVVLKIENEKVICGKKDNIQEQTEFEIKDIVRVAEFGEPIFPYLKPIDSVCNNSEDGLWHTLIQADNYHALQLLDYLYAGQVDCIYIDPPYNTGARDWKYNNDYVDGNDTYRHSKWLSFMEKRLKLAKKLLNPKNSVLIVTIDEKEYLHLGCLLEEMFPEAKIQMISTVINPKGAPRVNQFMRLDEYIFFVQFGEACPQKLNLPDDFRTNASDKRVNKLLRWQGLAKTQYSREGHPDTFYPIYLDKECTKIVEIGDPIGVGVDRNTIPDKEGCITVWPINKASGAEAQWSLSAPKLRNNLEKGYVRVAKSGTAGIYYLTSGVIKQIEEGDYEIIGRDTDGSIIIDETGYEYKFVPGTAWSVTSHDATRYGSDLNKLLMPDRAFPFPKSVYAVEDCIRFFVADKPDALIVDFFAGSGTTANAVMLLNHLDGGHRRSVSVTNNEVSENDVAKYNIEGFSPEDSEYACHGIAQYYTWPRIKAAVLGKDTTGKTIKGNYKFLEEFSMSDGFKTNAAFFKLSFLDKTAVALGLQFKEMLPTLWMKAGAIGKCPELTEDNLPDMLVLPENKFAVLINENAFAQFEEELADKPEIQTVYLITDYEVNYRSMAKSLCVETTYQLYRDYLDNFRINHGRN